MFKCRAYQKYSHTINSSTDSEGNQIEGYKTIPSWVCRNLVLYGNCFVNNKTYERIELNVLKEYDPKMEVKQMANGWLLKA